MTIYFMRKGLDGPIKIGFTSSAVERRISQLQTGHHERLYLIGTIPGTMEEEKLIHKELIEYHIQGEWFEAKPELLQTIDDVVANERASYYFRQIKFNKIDVENRGLKVLVAELKATIKSLEDCKKAKELIKTERTHEKFVRRINREVARRKVAETKLAEALDRLKEHDIAENTSLPKPA